MDLQKMARLLEGSPQWHRATQAINRVVDEYNRKGIKMTPKARDTLNEIRFLVTCLADKDVFDAMAEEVYNHLSRPGA
jgi:hypothetical protein